MTGTVVQLGLAEVTGLALTFAGVGAIIALGVRKDRIVSAELIAGGA